MSHHQGPMGLIPASPDPDTSPVSGRDGGPARPCARSQGRGCARPASEGSLDESPSRPDGLTGVGRAHEYSPASGRQRQIVTASGFRDGQCQYGRRQSQAGRRQPDPIIAGEQVKQPAA